MSLCFTLKLNLIVLSLCVGVICWTPLLAHAGESPVSGQLDGREIAQRVYDRDNGQASQAKLQMILIERDGSERIRELDISVKEENALDKRLVRFTSPSSIAGTGFLNWENSDRDDDQFLYLPALRRTRRISSSQKSRSFVNSEFTYEDMERRRVNLDQHKLLREAKFEKFDCWVLESIPTAKSNSQYAKRVSWITKDSLVPVQIEFYDKKSVITKRYTVEALEKTQGIWTATNSAMQNLEDGKGTRLKILQINYNATIASKNFTQGYLERAN